jgi:hypothetical protein
MELTRRLCSELRSTAIVMGVLTGPRTLKAMFEDSAGLDGLYANLARGYGEAGIGGLVLVEDVPLDDTADLAVLRPLANVASYFGIPVVLVDPYRSDPAGDEDWTLTRSESVGDDLLLQDPGTTGWLPLATAERPLVTTVGEVDPGIPVESLVAWREYVEATSFAERPR